MQRDKITSENSVNIDNDMAPLPHPISKNEKEPPSVSSWTWCLATKSISSWNWEELIIDMFITINKLPSYKNLETWHLVEQIKLL